MDYGLNHYAIDGKIKRHFDAIETMVMLIYFDRLPEGGSGGWRSWRMASSIIWRIKMN